MILAYARVMVGGGEAGGGGGGGDERPVVDLAPRELRTLGELWCGEEVAEGSGGVLLWFVPYLSFQFLHF